MLLLSPVVCWKTRACRYAALPLLVCFLFPEDNTARVIRTATQTAARVARAAFVRVRSSTSDRPNDAAAQRSRGRVNGDPPQNRTAGARAGLRFDVSHGVIVDWVCERALCASEVLL